MPEQPDLTEAEYTAAIPECCSLETLEDHLDIGLCWSITNGKPVGENYCGGCDLKKLEVNHET